MHYTKSIRLYHTTYDNYYENSVVNLQNVSFISLTQTSKSLIKLHISSHMALCSVPVSHWHQLGVTCVTGFFTFTIELTGPIKYCIIKVRLQYNRDCLHDPNAPFKSETIIVHN